MRINPRLLLLAPILAGCTLGPDFQTPDLKTPSAWRDAQSTGSVPVAGPVATTWWEQFGDATLTRLVQRVADSNLDLREAEARLAESRAELRVAGAAALPKADGNTSYTRERASSKGVVSLFSSDTSPTATQSNGLGGRQSGIPAGLAGGLPPFDLWQYGFDASWEVDLWGRVRRSVENASATTDASEAALHDTMLVSIAEVANDYLQLRGVQERLRITHENLSTARQSVSLTQERVRGGLATEVDLAEAEGQAADTGAAIPPLEQEQHRLINAIGLLLGQYPGALEAELLAPSPVPAVPATVPVGLPSELARRRPDIREAEAQLHAATAEIGVAKADFFPQVTLSGSAALQSLQFKDLAQWGARSYSIGPAISIPIFEGGRLSGTVALREAEQQEAAAKYQQTVLAAFRDVDDALSAYAAEQRRRIDLDASVDAARRALILSDRRYRQGLGTYLDVLTAQRSLLSGQQQLASSTATIDTDLVALYKALGGGWEAFPETASAAGIETGSSSVVSSSR
jgi:NodT family efflux transporter outer membrane factor (OMF) lipoprotein